MRSDQPARLYALHDAAQTLGVSIWTLRKNVVRGTIHVTRIGRRVLVPSEEIERIRRDGLPSLGEKAAQARSRCEHCTHGSEVVDQQSPKSQQSDAVSAAEERSNKMSDSKTATCEVKSITLDPRVEKEVAVAAVQIGGIQIRGVRIYASKKGKPKVYLPGLKHNGSWVDAVVLPDELREEMEAKVLEAYDQQQKAQATTKVGRHGAMAAATSVSASSSRVTEVKRG